MTLDKSQVEAEECLILDVSEAINKKMDEKKIKKAHIARQIGVSRQLVCQLLGGGRNLELRSLARIAHAMGCEVEIKLVGKVDDMTDKPKTDAPERIWTYHAAFHYPLFTSHKPGENIASVEYIRADSPELVRLRRIAKLVNTYRELGADDFEVSHLCDELDDLLAAQLKTGDE